MPLLRTFRSGEFDAADLVAAKAGRTISLCLPARDEQDTVGAIVGAVRSRLVEELALIDEIVVVDDHSTDRTAAVAADAGALVVAADEILPSYGLGHGKGEALWKSLAASSGDLVVWCDADVRNFDPSFVVGLLGPLLTRTDVGFVKGFYDRPEGDGTGGGRVTELVAATRDQPPAARSWPASSSRWPVSTPAAASCSSSCRSSRATASTSGCCSTSSDGSGCRRWPRSTWASACTATARSSSSRPRPWP